MEARKGTLVHACPVHTTFQVCCLLFIPCSALSGSVHDVLGLGPAKSAIDWLACVVHTAVDSLVSGYPAVNNSHLMHVCLESVCRSTMLVHSSGTMSRMLGSFEYAWPVALVLSAAPAVCSASLIQIVPYRHRQIVTSWGAAKKGAP